MPVRMGESTMWRSIQRVGRRSRPACGGNMR
jgi:hypothetical protein